MSYWKSIDTIYLYDGTLEGLFTIVFKCYLDKTLPLQILPKEEYIPNLLDATPFFIQTDYEKADRIEKGILKNISYPALYNVHYAFLCEEKR